MGKESACNAGDTGDEGLIPGWGRFPGEGNGNPLQYPCLENSVDRGTWWATVHRVANSWKQLSDGALALTGLLRTRIRCVPSGDFATEKIRLFTT